MRKSFKVFEVKCPLARIRGTVLPFGPKLVRIHAEDRESAVKIFDTDYETQGPPVAQEVGTEVPAC
jgi:hypothetical protein